MKTLIQFFGALIRFHVTALVCSIGTSFAATVEFQPPTYQKIRIDNISASPAAFPIALNDDGEALYWTLNSVPSPAIEFLQWLPQARRGVPAGSSFIDSIKDLPQGIPSAPRHGFDNGGGFAAVGYGYVPGQIATDSAAVWNGAGWLPFFQFGQISSGNPATVYDRNASGDVILTFVNPAVTPANRPNINIGFIEDTPGRRFWKGNIAAMFDARSGSTLPFFNQAGRQSVPRKLNNRGQVVGIYADGPAPGTAGALPRQSSFRGFTGTFGAAADLDLVSPRGGVLQPTGINDWGEIVGFSGNYLLGWAPFIYLPAANYGLPEGLQEIGPITPSRVEPEDDTSSSALNRTRFFYPPQEALINAAGMVIYNYVSESFTNAFTNITVPGFWQFGHHWTVQSLVNNLASGEAVLGADDLNNRGEILAKLAPVSPIGLLRPLLGATVALVAGSCRGDPFTVKLTLTNQSGANLTGLSSPGIEFHGVGDFTLLEGPTVLGPDSLAPGGTGVITWLVRVSDDPTGGFFIAQGTALDPSQRVVNSLLAQSPAGVGQLFRTEVTAVPDYVGNGEEIEVHSLVTNGLNDPLSNVRPDGVPAVAGTGGADFKSGPMPAVAVSLNPGASFTFTNIFVATKSGKVTFSGKALGSTPQCNITSSSGTTAPVTITPGDLLIKRGFEPSSSFAGGGVCQQEPIAMQISTNAVVTNEPSVFQVQVVNRAKEPKTFILRAQSIGAGWAVQYKIGSQDFTSQLEGAAGATLPELAAGSSLVVDLTMTTSAAPLGSNLDIALRLTALDEPTLIVDAVKAVSILAWVPVKIKFHAVNSAGLTSESILAGKNDINAPLEPISDIKTLNSQPVLVSAALTTNPSDLGLVADGVTPLLVEVTADPKDLALFPNGHQFRLTTRLNASGFVEGAIKGMQPDGSFPEASVHVLDPVRGSWGQDPVFRLKAEQPTAFIWIGPIAADDLTLARSILGASYEVKSAIHISDFANGVQAEDKGRFSIRKPPIFLLHGYNTDGNWGSLFRKELSTRYEAILENSPDNFVRTIIYGQPKSLQEVAPNTILSLSDCAVLAAGAMGEAKAQLKQSWALTRVDVVGHSQGGVLARMLSNTNGNAKIQAPFRNEENNFRGRFHRVVTIGAPHNGSRLLYYITRLIKSRREFSTSGFTPLGALQPLLQPKFDPFGRQMKIINNPDPGAPWYSDSSAQFHLIRTTIDGGRSPAPGDGTPVYQELGLTEPGVGNAVVPRGSDGVVDSDSAGAYVPPIAPEAYVYDVPSSFSGIAHSHSQLFGTGESQVESDVVGRHVIHALDQNGQGVESTEFGSFRLPPLLDDLQRQLLDDAAARAAFAENEARIAAQNPSPRPAALSAQSSSYSFELNYLTNHRPEGDVVWLVEVYGPNEISTNGVTLSQHGPNSSQVTVEVEPSLVGDVVLHAFYVDDSGAVALIPSAVVVSRGPVNATLTGFEMLPSNSNFPVESSIDAHLLAHYSDGSNSLRYVSPEQITATSSKTNIVSLTSALRWEMLAPGSSQLVFKWAGLTATNEVSTVVSLPEMPSLTAQNGAPGVITLIWPTWASDYVLESTTDLSSKSAWHPVVRSPLTNNLQFVLTLPTSLHSECFRLRQ